MAPHPTGGSTDVTFDATTEWSNIGGYITHTAGSANLIVSKTGLYQLEFNVTIVANGGSWNAGTNKVASIDIIRSPELEQVSIAQMAAMALTPEYAQNVSSSFYLIAGDIINLRVQGNHSTATPYIKPLTNTFDLNTWFSWRNIN
jgi:hypothetical protein